MPPRAFAVLPRTQRRTSLKEFSAWYRADPSAYLFQIGEAPFDAAPIFLNKEVFRGTVRLFTQLLHQLVDYVVGLSSGFEKVDVD